MNRKQARSLQWRKGLDFLGSLGPIERLFRPTAQPQPAAGSGFRIVKRFAMRSDGHAEVVTAVSMREQGSRVVYRVSTQRELDGRDGMVRRSPWLGLRELMLKTQLEKQAMDFIAVEVAKRRVGDALVME